MQTLEISTQILKHKKLLSVDYFTSSLIQSKNSFNQQLYSNYPILSIQNKQKSLQENKCEEYFQKEQVHKEKYYRFKRLVNAKYFHKDLADKEKNQEYKKFMYQEDKYAKNGDKVKKTTLNSTLCAHSIILDNYLANSRREFQDSQEVKSVSKIKQKIFKNSPLKMNKKTPKSILSRYLIQQNYQQNEKSRTLQQSYEKILNPNKKGNKDISIYSKAYDRSLTTAFSPHRPRTVSTNIQKTTSLVKKIIQFSLSPFIKKPNLRSRIQSLSQRRSINDKYRKKQKRSILDDIDQNNLIKFLSQAQSIDPKRKGIFTLNDLKDIQRFQMSFVNYLKLKTKQKIDSYAYENKVRTKTSNLEKFHDFILNQFPIDNDSKRKLEKIFQNIRYEFELADRRKIREKR